MVTTDRSTWQCLVLQMFVVMLLPCSSIFVSVASAQPTTRPVEAVSHVLIVSIDGLRPDLLYLSETPNLRELCRTGTFTLWAKTTAASVTLPSHVSMLTGVVPETHAILWNGDLPLSQPVYPSVPSIFDLAHRDGITTALVAGKRKFSVLDVPGSLDWKWIAPHTTSEDPDVIAAATEILRDHQPGVMFVHLPSVDNAGHAHGWGSAEQLAAVKNADASIGQLMKLLTDLDLAAHTIVIITADHGGAGRTHGPDDARSRTIPWIIAGPGIRHGFDLTLLGRGSDVYVYDTFATTAAILGITVRGNIDGHNVTAAFEDQELMVSTFRPSMQPATQPAKVDR